MDVMAVESEQKKLDELIRVYESKDYPEAIKLGKEFTNEYKHRGSGWNVLALAYKANGDIRDAVEIFKFLITALPTSPIYPANLGNTYMMVGKLNAAIKCFKKAIKLDPKMVNAIEALGLAYTERNQPLDAAECFKKVIQLEPRNQSSPYYLGNLYLADKNWEAAAKLLSTSTLGLSQSHLLECLLCLDRVEEFKRCYEDLTSKGLNNPLIGGVVAHANLYFNECINNTFCNDSMGYISLDRIEESDGFTSELAAELIRYHHGSKGDFRSQSLLNNGSQSSGNIFLLDEPFVAPLKRCIETKIAQYRAKFSNSREGFLAAWPDRYSLFGWLVSIKEGGNLDSHNHKEGWLSGSFYLSVPARESDRSIAGGIGFSIAGPRYPHLRSAPPEKIIAVNERDICMFPSSLFHRTVPTYSSGERVSFAFDVIPTN